MTKQGFHGIVRAYRRLFAVLDGELWPRYCEPACLRRSPVRAQCGRTFRHRWRNADMTAVATALSQRLRPLLAAACLGAASTLISAPAQARGPEGIADV